jgi:hypothetical protein
MNIAITEPYFHLIHGLNNSDNTIMVVYDYSLDDFYNYEWISDFEFYYKNLIKKLNEYHNVPHDLLRNYMEGIKKKKLYSLNLVKTYEDSRNRSVCVLYTYRINLFKRIWRKKRNANTFIEI